MKFIALLFTLLSLPAFAGTVDVGVGNATMLQGRGIAATAPTDTQVLTWDAATSSWKPASASSGSGTVTSVAMSVPTFLSVAGSPITTNGTLAVTLSGTALPVANGGTGLTAGTSGGILAYTGTGTIASSGALTASALVLGGGAGAAPTPMGSLGTTTTLLHGNAAGAPTFGAVSLTADVSGALPLVNGGTGTAAASANAAFNALSPMTTGGDLIYGGASGVATRLANGTAGNSLVSSGTTVAPTWAAINLAGGSAYVTGTLPVGNGGTGATAFTQKSIVFAGASGVYTQNNSKLNWDNTNFSLGVNMVGVATLDIGGTARVSGPNITPASGAGLEFGYDTGTPMSFMNSYDRTGSAFKLMHINALHLSVQDGVAGNFGVGVAPASTTAKLHTTGTVRFDSFTTPGILINDSSGNITAATTVPTATTFNGGATTTPSVTISSASTTDAASALTINATGTGGAKFGEVINHAGTADSAYGLQVNMTGTTGQKAAIAAYNNSSAAGSGIYSQMQSATASGHAFWGLHSGTSGSLYFGTTGIATYAGSMLNLSSASTSAATGATLTMSGATGAQIGLSVSNASQTLGANGVVVSLTGTAGDRKGISVTNAGTGTGTYAGYFRNSGTSGVHSVIVASTDSTGAGGIVYAEDTNTSSTGKNFYAQHVGSSGGGFYATATNTAFTGNIIEGTTVSTNASARGLKLTLTGTTGANVAAEISNASATAGAAAMLVTGHIKGAGTAPSVTANCGTSPTIAGNDTVGRITVGTGGTDVNCTITFAVAWATAPACIVGDETTSLLLTGVASTTTLSISAATPLGAADKLVYHCVGY